MLETIKNELNRLDAPKDAIKSFENNLTAIAAEVKLEDVFRIHEERVKADPSTKEWPVHPWALLKAITDKNLKSLDLKKVRDLRDEFLKLRPSRSPSRALVVLGDILALIEHAAGEAQTGESAYGAGLPLMRDEYDNSEWRVLLRMLRRKIYKVLRIEP